MDVKVVLVDLNPKMVQAWKRAFEDEPEVQVVRGSLLAQPTTAWVSPTNARGSMDGGVDAAVRSHLGGRIQARVQGEIGARFAGHMPVGYATCVETGRNLPAFLISTPTMFASSEDVRATMNAALACCAAFQAVSMFNAEHGPVIRSVAVPGLGAGTGRVPVDVCAELMWSAYNLFREQAFPDFATMRAALENEVGDLGGLSPAATAAAQAMRARIFEPQRVA